MKNASIVQRTSGYELPQDEYRERLKAASELVNEQGKEEEALRVCQGLIEEDPEDPIPIFLMGQLYTKAEKWGMAWQFYKRVLELTPTRAEPWSNLGMCAEGLSKHKLAVNYFTEAIKRAPDRAGYWANRGLAKQHLCEYEAARKDFEKALEIDPENHSARRSMAFSQLINGDWENGWEGYQLLLRTLQRRECQYQNEDRWDGSPGKTVVLYGEQGIGDEIMFASIFQEAIEISAKVIIECEPRLTGLFKRSFPKADVYGTRWAKEITWPNLYEIDANCTAGMLPKFFRKSPKDCPGSPYLKPDPERVLMWRSLMDSWGTRPKIGLCWSSGRKNTGIKFRTIGLEAFRPIIESLDADFVSLQYKDCQKEIDETGLPVKWYPRAMMGDDYDDTAAIIDNLDMVLGVHTTATHCAGALGVPAVVLVPHPCLWLYSGDSMPWYKSLTLFKQKPGESWPSVIGRLMRTDLVNFRRVSGGAEIAA